MKKIYNIICLLLCCSFCFMFTACNQTNAIKMNVYFSNDVSVNVYTTVTTNKKIELSKVTQNSPYETEKFLKYELTSNKDYFYGLYVEKISFYIYSTVDKEIEFNITITGTENGQDLMYSETKDFILEHEPFALKANKSVKCTIAVNDRITLSESPSKIIIALSDYVDVIDDNFSYCLYGFQVYGQH